jgi:hypothetical protein
VSDGQTSGVRARSYEMPALGGAAPQLLEIVGGCRARS